MNGIFLHLPNSDCRIPWTSRYRFLWGFGANKLDPCHGRYSPKIQYTRLLVGMYCYNGEITFISNFLYGRTHFVTLLDFYFMKNMLTNDICYRPNTLDNQSTYTYERDSQCKKFTMLADHFSFLHAGENPFVVTHNSTKVVLLIISIESLTHFQQIKMLS